MSLKKRQRVVVLLSEVELSLVESFQSDKKLASRGAAIRHILSMGLAAYQDQTTSSETLISR